MIFAFFFFKQKTAYEMRISDWSSDVCSSDLMRVSPFAVVPNRIGDSRAIGALASRGRGRTSAGTALARKPGEGSNAVAPHRDEEIGRASCRERVCQYV